jgi:hypothetical protein
VERKKYVKHSEKKGEMWNRAGTLVSITYLKILKCTGEFNLKSEIPSAVRFTGVDSPEPAGLLYFFFLGQNTS